MTVPGWVLMETVRALHEQLLAACAVHVAQIDADVAGQMHRHRLGRRHDAVQPIEELRTKELFCGSCV